MNAIMREKGQFLVSIQETSISTLKFSNLSQSHMKPW